MRIFYLCILLISSSFTPMRITSEPVVGYKEIEFKDKKSQLPRKMLVWYPVESSTEGKESSSLWDVFKIAEGAPILNPSEKRPLIVFSHGFSGSAHQLSWLTSKLVYHGYIVLSMKHQDMVNGRAQINFWQRANDISLMLDQYSSNSFAQFTDLNRIGFAGYSLGGTTGIMLAGASPTLLDRFVPSQEDALPGEFKGLKFSLYQLDKKKMSQSWKDPRIKSMFLMAPAWGWVFDKAILKTISIPSYIVAPVDDGVLVTKNNAEFFASSIPNDVYQTIPKANHYVFIAEPLDQEKIPERLKFLTVDPANAQREWIHYECAENAYRFFESSLTRENSP